MQAARETTDGGRLFSTCHEDQGQAGCSQAQGNATTQGNTAVPCA